MITGCVLENETQAWPLPAYVLLALDEAWPTVVIPTANGQRIMYLAGTPTERD